MDLRVHMGEQPRAHCVVPRLLVLLHRPKTALSLRPQASRLPTWIEQPITDQQLGLRAVLRYLTMQLRGYLRLMARWLELQCRHLGVFAGYKLCPAVG